MSEIVPVVRIMPSHPSQGAFVEINQSDFDPAKHELYVEPPVDGIVPPVPVLPPPGETDPLASLPEDWRDAKGAGVAKLKSIVQAVTGRTAANKEEAVQMIEAELKARADAVEAAKLPPPPAG